MAAMQQMLMASASSVAPLAPVVVSYIGAASGSFVSTNPQSISVVPIGTAAANRFVFIVVNYLTTNTGSILSAATIGGVTAKIHANTGSAPAHASGVFMGSALISALVPTGTSATVTLTFLSGSSGWQVWLDTYRVTNLISDTPVDTISTSTTTPVQPYSGTIDVKKDGMLIVGAMMTSAATSYTVSGATQDYQIPMNGSDQTGLGASLSVTADQLNRPISISRVGGGGTVFYVAIAAGSFR